MHLLAACSVAIAISLPTTVLLCPWAYCAHGEFLFEFAEVTLNGAFINLDALIGYSLVNGVAIESAVLAREKAKDELMAE